ncbi:Tad domain-containing protein [Vibrio japonicus]|uniref:Tad domain-containing protein n=1 Tax=Vibrio japonicus TaxID=1824638 RepID=A0ABY5LGT5_9VIBR|nr:Tad domain-containing protein [Vibrio japonicus]UUM30079.1 Tad domain-containing protein [Vibrio japonicus]
MKTLRVFRGTHKEQGLVVVIVTIAMLVILGVSALAIDINHAYMNRTKLQNGVDAAALAAAVILDQNGTEAEAETAANQALTKMSGSDGNAELDVTTADISVTFNDSSDFSGGACVLGGDCYVRVVASNLDLNSYFMQMFSDTKQVGASAVAGPSAGGNTCNVVPIAICAEDIGSDTGGFNDGKTYDLKLTSNNSPMGSGNFQLLDFDVDETESQDKKDSHIRNQLAGSYMGCVGVGDVVTTNPGGKVGPVAQGLNTRFGEGKLLSDYDSDGEVEEGITHDDYLASDAHNGRRELAVPIVDCTAAGTGKTDFDVVAVGCFFLVNKAPKDNSGKENIQGEFMEECTVQNSRNNGLSTRAGPYRIVLYKDPFNEDS